MYEYNFHLGYQKSFGGFPLLGTIKYPYPLKKGDVIIVANDLFEAIDRIAEAVSRDTLRYNQQYRIASIHHTVDFKSQVPDIYLVTEQDYNDKFSDNIRILSQVEKMLEESTLQGETQSQILKGLYDINHAKSKEEAVSTKREFTNSLNKIKEDSDTISAIILTE